MRIRNEARRLAENRNWMLGTAQVASVVIFPIIEAILLKNQASLGGLFVALGVPILVLHAIFGVFVFLATRTESFYFEFEDAQAEIAEREDAVQQLRQQLDEEREQRDDLDWTHETNDLALQYLHLLISNSDLHDGDSLKDAVGVVLRLSIIGSRSLASRTTRDTTSLFIYTTQTFSTWPPIIDSLMTGYRGRIDAGSPVTGILASVFRRIGGS